MALDPLEFKLRDGCEVLCKCWELNLGPLQEQLLAAEPFPASGKTCFTVNIETDMLPA